jgi:hypothetical protein
MLVALIAMIVAVFAYHLGLSEAIAKVVSKVARCPKCLTFWLVLLVLMITCKNTIVAISLSLLCAYLSNWVGLLLMWLNKVYNKVWERLNKVEP